MKIEIIKYEGPLIPVGAYPYEVYWDDEYERAFQTYEEAKVWVRDQLTDQINLISNSEFKT